MRKVLKVPSSFELLGHTITVALKDDLYASENCLGECDPDRRIIRLQKAGVDIELPKKVNSQKVIEKFRISNDIHEETYLHEIVHMILSYMGEEKLYENEKFVTMFAKCLHQIFKSSKI